MRDGRRRAAAARVPAGASAEGRDIGGGGGVDVVATGGRSGFIAASLSVAAGCLLVAVEVDAAVVPAGRCCGALAGDLGKASSAGWGGRRGERGSHAVCEELLRIARLIFFFRACGPDDPHDANRILGY